MSSVGNRCTNAAVFEGVGVSCDREYHRDSSGDAIGKHTAMLSDFRMLEWTDDNRDAIEVTPPPANWRYDKVTAELRYRITKLVEDAATLGLEGGAFAGVPGDVETAVFRLCERVAAISGLPNSTGQAPLDPKLERLVLYFRHRLSEIASSMKYEAGAR